jgi:hypothetical protein
MVWFLKSSEWHLSRQEWVDRPASAGVEGASGHHRGHPPWNATVMGVDWPEEVARLGNELDGEIVVYGSRRLSHVLIGWAWWTSCAYWSTRWCLVPGDRLFGEAQDKVALRLVESRPSGGGVVSMIYAPASANG